MNQNHPTTSASRWTSLLLQINCIQVTSALGGATSAHHVYAIKIRGLTCATNHPHFIYRAFHEFMDLYLALEKLFFGHEFHFEGGEDDQGTATWLWGTLHTIERQFWSVSSSRRNMTTQMQLHLFLQRLVQYIRAHPECFDEEAGFLGQAVVQVLGPFLQLERSRSGGGLAPERKKKKARTSSRMRKLLDENLSPLSASSLPSIDELEDATLTTCSMTLRRMDDHRAHADHLPAVRKRVFTEVDFEAFL